MMKLRGPIFLSVIAITFLAVAFLPQKPVNNELKESLLVRTILNHVTQLHYSPRTVDDEFSGNLYKNYLDIVDGGRRYLTQEDLVKLEPYQDKLDDEALSGNYEFFNISLELINAGIEKSEKYYREILASPFDFTLNESIELDGEKKAFAKNDAELKDYWRQLLKYETMTRLSRALDRQEEQGEEGETKPFELLEEEARQEVLERYDNLYEQIRKYRRSDRLSDYMNAMVTLFDPHTFYFQPVDKQNFDIRMSGRLEGIGARLSQDGDYTKVVDVVPGGPAWKGKELEVDDLITKVAQGDDGEWQDVTGWVLDEVIQLIRGKKDTKVRLTIKKVDGSLKEIEIVRDVIQFEETFARSLILDGPEGERVGYIYLPSFYIDFDDPSGRTCSKDVAEEIRKLKAENVSGIVLDLRNNGGGSLSEVIKMTGLFIEQGPIVQTKYRERKPEIYNDLDGKVLYDGPLAVLVNSGSASASEILAAAIQDYNRGVVIGSKSTFGKGTVQGFYDLDRSIRGLDDVKPLGEIKITTQKFYRISGGSNQLKGIVPDIILPDNYHFLDVGEKDMDFPLPWTEISPVPHQQSVYQVNNLKELQRRSEERIRKDETFNKILENARRIKRQQDLSKYPLNLEAYRQLSRKNNEEAEKYRDINEGIDESRVHPLLADQGYINADEKNKARTEDFIKSVSQDVHLKETLNVIHDLLQLN